VSVLLLALSPNSNIKEAGKNGNKRKERTNPFNNPRPNPRNMSLYTLTPRTTQHECTPRLNRCE
jgi:hypothetical protein